VKCYMCDNHAVVYNCFLGKSVCRECDMKYDIGKGFLDTNEIIYKGMRFWLYENSRIDNIKIKKIGSWRVGV